MAALEEMQPQEEDRRGRAEDALALIDVREAGEWELCRIEGARLLPLSRMGDWEHLLDPYGVRSRFACDRLARAGLRGLMNLTGGRRLGAPGRSVPNPLLIPTCRPSFTSRRRGYTSSPQPGRVSRPTGKSDSSSIEGKLV